MSRSKKKLPIREAEEAWELALANKGLVYKTLLSYVNSKPSIAWYKGEDLRAELESYAWEGMYTACLHWDETKGTLSTYAIPAIRNNMLKQVNKLVSMGGNRRGNTHSPPTEPFPHIFSAETISVEDKDDTTDALSGIGDIVPQPWQDENSFEDEIIERIDRERTDRAIRELVQRMPEPHREVFELLALGPQKEFAGRRSSQAPSMSRREAAERLHYSLRKVQDLYEEAVEWMGNQLDAHGYGNPYKEE